MPANRNVLAFVMAGGEGSRLHPLTARRCEPAAPLGGKHRILRQRIEFRVRRGAHASVAHPLEALA